MEFSHVSEPLFSCLTADLMKKKSEQKKKMRYKQDFGLWCEVVGTEDLKSLTE